MEKDSILTYEKKVLIRSEQVDMTRRLRMSELFRLMEEASIAHTEILGCTRDKTLDRGLLWIITRQQAEIEELPAYDEEIIVRSWQGDMMHVLFPRFYEIERAGKVIVRGQALWMLIEEESREMAMPEDYDIFIPGRPGSDDMMLPPIAIPKELAESSAPIQHAENSDAKDAASESASPAKQGLIIDDEIVTRFSQVDINGHMNNTRYFDIIDDAEFSYRNSYGNPEFPTPRIITANYLSELRAGDRFELKGYRDSAGTTYYEGADGDRIKFRIRKEY